MYPLTTSSIGSADIDGTGSFGFILLILIFSSLLISLRSSPASPSLSYVPPIATSPPLPSSPRPSYMYPVHPHLPARLIALVVTEP